MRRFSCQSCGNEIYFDNGFCVHCNHRLGFLADFNDMSAVEPFGAGWGALGGPSGQVFFCDNADIVNCNWLLPQGQQGGFCTACRHNRVVPDASVAGNVGKWRSIELAKRHLFYSLLRWRLPMPDRTQDPAHGLAFDFLAETRNANGTLNPVMTGHEDGVITLNIDEGDDATRERRRKDLGEPYRTLIGHMRHEVGHYYWDRLVADAGRQGEFRALFGDERADYGAALQRHYANGPPPDWAQRHVSAYAAAHPWEDFAESWAHWTHMVDGLETARGYGMSFLSIARDTAPNAANEHQVGFDPYAERNATRIVKTWVPLTIAINSVNRSMGQPDLYPFVLAGAVTAKLQFINAIIHAGRGG